MNKNKQYEGLEELIVNKDLILKAKDIFDIIYKADVAISELGELLLLNNYTYLVGKSFMTHKEYEELVKGCIRNNDWRELAHKYLSSGAEDPLNKENTRRVLLAGLEGLEERSESVPISLIGGMSKLIGKTIRNNNMKIKDVFDVVLNYNE